MVHHVVGIRADRPHVGVVQGVVPRASSSFVIPHLGQQSSVVSDKTRISPLRGTAENDFELADDTRLTAVNSNLSLCQPGRLSGASRSIAHRPEPFSAH